MLSHYPRDSLPSEVARIMLRATNEERGTVASLAALLDDMDDEHIDGMSSFLRNKEEEYSILHRKYIVRAQSATPDRAFVLGDISAARRYYFRQIPTHTCPLPLGQSSKSQQHAP